MAVQKQAVAIPFSKGMNQKVDPWQLPLENFELLENSIFTKDGLLQKRNGYGSLPSLPNSSNSYVTTLNDNLTAIGTAVSALDISTSSWVSKGQIQPLSLSTLSLIKNNVNQTQVDAAIAPNGLVCTVYTESNNGTNSYKYAIANVATGQNIIAPTAIPAGSGAISGSPRVFILGPYFLIVVTNTISAVSHLQYAAIPYSNPAVFSSLSDLVANYAANSRLSWDGVVVGSNLYVAYNTTSGGQNVKIIYLTQSLSISSATTLGSGLHGNLMSVTADVTSPSVPVIYASFVDTTTGGSNVLYSACVDQFLNVITAPTTIVGSGTFVNVASAAQGGSVKVFLEVVNAYSYDAGLASNYVISFNMTQAGTPSAVTTVIRSVGLASKAFIVNGIIYFLSAYSSPYQPTYFLINGSLSTSASPVITAKLAYQNGGGYLTLGLPSVSVSGTTAQVPYLFKDLISAVNKGTALPSGTQTAGIYSQTGINLGSFYITSTSSIDTAEIAANLHMSGGFLWQYDGYLPVEHNFFLYPSSIEATWSASGGSIHAQPDGATNTNAYWYQVTYEWSDNQGNIYRSAPSIPVSVTTTSNGTTGSITVNVPTLRLTYKTANPVKIVIYRWSVGQQEYYQVTSLTAPTLNSTTTDSIAFVDTLADATILGNNLLYTTGGVVEDVNAPATNIMTLFDTRLWLVDAEDPNLLWFSKQVIEATPVEMSDLLTFYVAPNTGTTGTTGPITALAPMDDKLIIFKKNAIYYINGAGPDNTGSNSQYSQAIFITSTVGSDNQASIVLTPNGLMFQSDKGIWLLGRDLSTSYIGAAVENFNDQTVTSANAIPETNQVRFTLSDGDTVVYDYYYSRWGTFVGVPAISSCVYQDQHTFINSLGEVFQETPGAYLDGSNPVLVSFTTSWINVAGVQGYQRAFFFYLLGQYLSPHKLSIQVAYDYNPSAYQSSFIMPTNFSGVTASPYGAPVPFGGPASVENWRVFLGKQRCQSFQITCQEIYDPSLGVSPGAGLTLSGLNLVVGIKKGWRNIGNAHTAGGNIANG